METAFGRFTKPYCPTDYSYERMLNNDFYKLCKKDDDTYKIINSNDKILGEFNGKLNYESYDKNDIFDNGQAKIYNINGILEFEGDIKDGKRWNGKQMDVYNGEIFFKGKYKDGKLTGYEYKDYYFNNKEYSRGEITFEGEYKDGKRNGHGKEYHDRAVAFEGEYKDGKIWNGKGKQYIDGILEFEGDIKDGKRWNGKGKEYHQHGDRNMSFKGEYKDGVKNGIFYNEYGLLSFEGENKDGKIWNGKEKEYYSKSKGKHNLHFECEYKDGIKLNIKEYNISGDLSFEGEYKDNEIWNGKGTRYDTLGRVLHSFSGEFKEGKIWTGRDYYSRSEYKDGIKISEFGIKSRLHKKTNNRKCRSKSPRKCRSKSPRKCRSKSPRKCRSKQL